MASMSTPTFQLWIQKPLPVAKPDYTLSGSNMAALAIKASSALTRASKQRGNAERLGLCRSGKFLRAMTVLRDLMNLV